VLGTASKADRADGRLPGKATGIVFGWVRRYKYANVCISA
jgi:hypothetical protein